jgi:hypothetical protein
VGCRERISVGFVVAESEHTNRDRDRGADEIAHGALTALGHAIGISFAEADDQPFV